MIAAPGAVPFWSPEEIAASMRGTLAHLEARDEIARAVHQRAQLVQLRRVARADGSAVLKAHGCVLGERVPQQVAHVGERIQRADQLAQQLRLGRLQRGGDRGQSGGA